MSAPTRNSKRNTRNGSSGFTLIEVLVVISIIAILIALLLPALAGSRDAARAAMCLANQQQLMVGVNTYAHDYNGRIPFGPENDAPSPSNFYPVTGMVTSLISRADASAPGGGSPVGAGLMLKHYLSHSPEAVFCPGADDPIDAAAELAVVGSDWAVSNYYYRHGSSTQFAQKGDAHTRLDRLGTNSLGRPIAALFLDQNFHAKGSVAYKVLKPRTNHKERVANAAYADGHAESLNNDDRRYSIDVGLFVTNADAYILATLERADTPASH